MSRYACLRVPYFAAAAAERAEPGLREHPLAVMKGTSPATRVVEANAQARVAGVRPGMPEAEARAHCLALVGRSACEAMVASAHDALLAAALAISPRVEDAGPGIVYVDLAGLERLFGEAIAIARRLAREARAVGLVGQVGAADTRMAARIAATRARGPANVIPSGHERETLASIPIDVLELSQALGATLERWGVRTLGELANLPREELALRLGPAGLRAHDLARGLDREPFHLYVPPPYWEEAHGLDWELDSLDALGAVVEAVVTRLCARLDAVHLAADTLTCRLALATGGRHDRTVALAVPMYEPKPMFSLVRVILETHPPPAPIVAVAIQVQPVARRPTRRGFWEPPSPALRDLATVLARLTSLVGADNVGSPRVGHAHRPDAFTLESFVASDPEGIHEGRGVAGAPGPGALNPSSRDSIPTLALRRLRPPRPVEVEVIGDRPALVNLSPTVALRVVACTGPWRGSGEWWDAHAWARDEWDVALTDHTLCRLAYDRVVGAWFLDGAYD
jgi:protein ImuB